MRQSIILAITILMCFCSCNREEDKRDALYKEITSVNKLVLSSMAINKIGEYDDESNWKIGKRIAVYSYDTYMRAYIDLSLLKPEDFVIDETAKTAELTLPAIQTEFQGRDIAMKEEHYRVTGLRSQIGSKERAELKEKMNASLKKEVMRNPTFRDMLLDAARKKAVLFFGKIIESQGYTPTIYFQ